jgi:hypothetical protein
VRAALLAVLLLAACGKSKEKEFRDMRESLCHAAVGGSVGAATGLNALGPVCPDIQCSASFLTGRAKPFADCLAGSDPCRLIWEWTPNDSSLCGATGCAYLCEAFSKSSGGIATISDEICGANFFGEQPTSSCSFAH